MPTPPISEALLLEALNLEEEYGSAKFASRACGIPETTLRNRLSSARLAGLKPTFRKESPRVSSRQRLGRMHLIIPDVQMKHGVRDDHMTWIGNFIAEKRPDVIVQIGDFADMESLSTYHTPREREGKRYLKDLVAVRRAQEKLFAPFPHDFLPRKVLTLGNHEHRINRWVDEHPEFEDKVSIADLGFEEFGWEVHPYLKVVNIDGVEYSHFFTSGVMGRPCASAAVQLRERQCSSIAGHVQHTDIALHRKTQQIAIFCGTCYLHDEKYLGQQDNCQRRQILVLHEVEDGRFDPMFVSLRFLEKAYS